MQMNDPAQPTVGFVSLGCAKNLVDSQIMAGALVRRGLSLAPSTEEADVIIVNTCAFIEEARAESLEHIHAVCRLKSAGSCRAVIVAGCLSQRYRQRLRTELPEVDAFIGLDEIDRVDEFVRRAARGEHGLVEVSPAAGRIFEPPVPGLVFSGGVHAYVKIAEGCNHRCAFCAIPAIRGRRRSRAPANILAEARALLDNGFKELDLIAQDTTSYGRDMKDVAGPAGLVRRLAELPGRFWIRLLYSYPSRITDELLEALGSVPNLCRYLDVPVQHSHPEMLKAMRRGNTADAVRRLAGRVRAAVPGITLRTTCLVGFPGEREEHFRRLLDYVREARFDHLGCFVFSPEDGTPACDLPDRPPREVAEERCRALLAAQMEIVAQKAGALLGDTADALLERRHEDVWVARTERQAPESDGCTYIVDAPGDWRPGTFVPIRYTDHDEYDMVAEPFDDER